MKSYRKELWFETATRRAYLNITPEVEAALKESGVSEGLALVNAMHITASVFINDDESGLHADYDAWLERLAPHEPVSGYRHNRTGEDNADAHMKRQIMGREVMVAVTAGKLDFGPWEQIFYGEFDGRRRKRALVKISPALPTKATDIGSESLTARRQDAARRRARWGPTPGEGPRKPRDSAGAQQAIGRVSPQSAIPAAASSLNRHSCATANLRSVVARY